MNRPTGASIQALSCFSSAIHPAAVNPDDAQQPSTDDMIPMQGFDCGLLGRRIRSLGRGGRRGPILLAGIVVLRGVRLGGMETSLGEIVRMRLSK